MSSLPVTCTQNTQKSGFLNPRDYFTPDCTLTTAVFRPSNPNHSHITTSLENTIKNTKALLAIPVYLVIYGDNETIPLLREIRENYGHTHLTRFYTIEKSEIWTFQYEFQVLKNRAVYHPSANERHTVETHLLQCNKADFVLQTMQKDPFHTQRFGWVDAFLGEETIRICQNYNIHVLPNLLNQVQDDKFHIQILNVANKKYVLPENKREYYEKYQYVVCGGFYVCGKEIGTKILTRVKDLFVQTTNLGYGHGEEMLYLEIIEEYYDDIVRSYGDYSDMWDNFIEPTTNVHYIYWQILMRYLILGYYKEAFQCCRTVLRSMIKCGNGVITPAVLTKFNVPLHVFDDYLREYLKMLKYNYSPPEYNAETDDVLQFKIDQSLSSVAAT